MAGLFSGCKEPAIRSATSTSGAPYEPQFQNESQFVVHAIVSDLAQEIYFAKYHRLPNQKHFSTEVTESGGSVDEPIYHVRIRFGSKVSDQNLELKIGGPIWSPEVYQPVTVQLARAMKFSAPTSSHADDTLLLSSLLDSTAETIERDNEELSKALDRSFADAQLHEKAALLLGAFVLRERSGKFFDARSPLSRLTSHLAVAKFLRGPNSFGINGRMAEVMMLTLVNDQAAAVEQLSTINTNNPVVAALVRGLQARNTGDYRPLTAMTNCSPFESIEWFYAYADRVDLSLAWPKLTEEQRQTIDFVRAANESVLTVEAGHELSMEAIPLELEEVESVYRMTHPGAAIPSSLPQVLNVFPKGSCFDVDSKNKARVRVIDWGQWAMFFQRQLCHTEQRGFDFLNTMLGDPDGAKEFAVHCDHAFDGLMLQPFVHRLNATEADGYHKAVDDGLKVIAATPQFVPAGCWNSLFAPVTFAPPYSPASNLTIHDWFNHNPLPGTAYDVKARLDQGSLTNRADAIARLEALHEMAPYHRPLARFILHATYKGGYSTYEQAMAVYGKMLPYSPLVMRAVAEGSLTGDVEKYVQLMTQAAEQDPSYYYDLDEFWFRMNNFTLEDKAAEYFQKGFDADPDRVGASNHAGWLVKHWLKRGQIEKARAVAEDAGAVYSEDGLCALEMYQEAVSNYDGAFQTLANLEERYDDSTPLLNFCFNYKAKTGDAKFDPELQKRVGKLFPKGMEKVSLSDFKGPPIDGVAFSGGSPAMYTNHMQMSDVIVAVYGVRVHGMAQYTFARTLKDTLELDLIVWQGDAYHELRPYVPGHLFGVNIADYNPYRIER